MLTEIPGTLFLKRSLLIVEWPDGSQQNLVLVQDVTRVGRGSEGNELAVPQEFKSISRRHFEIRRLEQGYQLQDLGSGNGVLLNGQMVENAMLKDGDEIRFGMVEAGQEVQIKFYQGTELQLRSPSVEPVAVAAMEKLRMEPPSGGPFLMVRLPAGQIGYFAIEKEISVIGRDERADLPLFFPFISARHFELRRVGAAFSITELGSANGSLVNNQALPALVATPIHDRSIIRLGDESYGISLSLTFCNPLEPAAPLDGFSLSGSPVAIVSSGSLVIGRADECDIHLGAPEISRRHAAIRRQDSSWVLEDLGSVNGTFVNDRRVKSVELQDGNLIRIGTYVLLFQNGQVSPYQSDGMRLDVIGLVREVETRAGRKRLLDDINFSVLPREFVVLLGDNPGRGSLLQALVGKRPEAGQVLVNGTDFYRDYEQFRNQLGYLPGQDILPESLSVEMALDYTARLRLPASISPLERKERIRSALETVSLNSQALRRTKIKLLPAGQRKRANLAAELLADPRLIYIEDASLGLDAGAEKKLLNTLRRVADEGRTVILRTQASGNIIQADQVAVLEAGQMVYFGPTQEALNFFEVAEFADIHDKIEHNGEKWRRIYQQGRPAVYQKYVLDRRASAKSTASQALSGAGLGLVEQLKQFWLLTQRAVSVLLNEPLNLALMALLLPVLGLLLVVGGSRQVLTGNPLIHADPVGAARNLFGNYMPAAKANIFLLVMGLEAVLTGLFLTSRALVRERPAYLRERMANLQVLPYFFSKLLIYKVFGFFQVLLLFLVLLLGIDFPRAGVYLPSGLEMLISLLLSLLAGLGLGFMISAFSRSTEMANSLVALVLLLQVVFAGPVFDLRGSPLEMLSYLTATRWSATALGLSAGLPQLAEDTILCDNQPGSSPARLVCVNHPDARADLHLDYSPDQLIKSWLVLTGMIVLELGVSGVQLARERSK